MAFASGATAFGSTCENYTGTFDDVAQPLVLQQAGCDKIALVTIQAGKQNQFDIIPGKTIQTFLIGDQTFEYRWSWSGPHLAITRSTTTSAGKLLEVLVDIYSLDQNGDLHSNLTYTSYNEDGSTRTSTASAFHKRLK
jgi:hypothetical protein